MKNILIIGGTRNIGYQLAKHMVEAGHRLTLLNRGVTSDDLPSNIHRLRCDRTDPQQMRRALANRQFDMVVDMALYRPAEAESIADLLKGKVGRYVAISSGQVYLVQTGTQRPFKEVDYGGEPIPAPTPNTYDYEEWLYGVEKRGVEDALFAAHERDGFPVTTFRLPMVNSERDTFRRLYGYILRIRDGGPILVPQTPNHPLRHIYGGDVVAAVAALLETSTGIGRAYNISQEETLNIEDFLSLLGDALGKPPRVEFVPRDVLAGQGFLPDCSPFSDVWMSELDNARSKQELGVTYTPVPDYLQRIVAYHNEHPTEPPASYRRRQSEKNLISTI